MLIQQESTQLSKKMGGLGFVLAHQQGSPCPIKIWPWLCTLEGHCWRSQHSSPLGQSRGGGQGFRLVSCPNNQSGFSRAPGDVRSWWGAAPTQPSPVRLYPPRCTKPSWNSCKMGWKTCRTHRICRMENWLRPRKTTNCFGTDEVFFLANDLVLMSHMVSWEVAAFGHF